MGVYAWALSISEAMRLHGITQFCANGFRAAALLGSIQWKALLPFVAGSLVSAALFLGVEFVPSRAFVFIGLGLVPFITLLPKFPRLDFAHPYHAFACGFFSSAIQLIAGVSGPFLDVFFVRSKWNRFQVIATKGTSQIVGHALKIFYFTRAATEGAIESFTPSLVIGLAVAALVGTLIGGRILKKMSDRNFRVWTQRIVLTLGAVYLVKGAQLFMNG